MWRVLVPSAWRVAILAQVVKLFEDARLTEAALFIQEDDVRRAPHRVRKEAARLAGHDDFENLRRGRQLADEPLPWIDGQRLHGRKMTQDCKDISFGGSQGHIESDTAELQHGIGLIKMPGNIGAEGDCPLETFVNNIDGRLR